MTKIRVRTETLQQISGQMQGNSSTIGGVGGSLIQAGSGARTYERNTFGPEVKAICSESNALASRNSVNVMNLSSRLSNKLSAFLQADLTFQTNSSDNSSIFTTLEQIGGFFGDWLNSKKEEEFTARWQKMSLKQREKFLNDFQSTLISKFNYPMIITTIVFTDLDDSSGNYHGFYLNGTVTVDTTDLEKESPFSLMRTIAHENRHALQDQAVNDSKFRSEDITEQMVDKWKNNLSNYVKSEDDFEGYWNQPIEKDAREFAKDYVNDYVSDYDLSNSPRDFVPDADQSISSWA